MTETEPVTLADLARHTREINQLKGWDNQNAGWGDLVALLHTEISEMVGAWRKYRLAPHAKSDVDTEGWPIAVPDGVAAEWSDCVIRLIDMCQVHNIKLFDMDMCLEDVADLALVDALRTFGDWISWLHNAANDLWHAPTFEAPLMLRSLVTFARRMNIPMTLSVREKLASNRHRQFQHGGTIGTSVDLPPAPDPYDSMKGGVSDADEWAHPEVSPLPRATVVNLRRLAAGEETYGDRFGG